MSIKHFLIIFLSVMTQHLFAIELNYYQHFIECKSYNVEVKVVILRKQLWTNSEFNQIDMKIHDQFADQIFHGQFRDNQSTNNIYYRSAINTKSINLEFNPYSELKYTLILNHYYVWGDLNWRQTYDKATLIQNKYSPKVIELRCHHDVIELSDFSEFDRAEFFKFN